MCWRESKQENNWLFISLSIMRGLSPRQICGGKKKKVELAFIKNFSSQLLPSLCEWLPLTGLQCHLWCGAHPGLSALCRQLHSPKAMISAGFQQQLNNTRGSDSKLSSERGREIIHWVDDKTEIQRDLYMLSCK